MAAYYRIIRSRQYKYFSPIINLRIQYFSVGVDDKLHGFTKDESKFRETIYSFCQNELTPHAERIDKDDGWANLR